MACTSYTIIKAEYVYSGLKIKQMAAK